MGGQKRRCRVACALGDTLQGDTAIAIRMEIEN